MEIKKQQKGQYMEQKTDSILGFIMNHAGEHLDEVQFGDAECIRLNREMEKKFKKLSRANLTRKQDRAVDELLTIYNEENSWCCKLLYRQGFIDCVSLLKEIGVI